MENTLAIVVRVHEAPRLIGEDERFGCGIGALCSRALFERHINPALYDALLGAASRASVRPSTVHHIATAEEGAQELYGGSCNVAFLTRAGAWRIARNGLAMRPLEQPNLELSTKLIAKASNSSRVVSNSSGL